jgi:hypothetical protein
MNKFRNCLALKILPKHIIMPALRLILVFICFSKVALAQTAVNTDSLNKLNAALNAALIKRKPVPDLNNYYRQTALKICNCIESAQRQSEIGSDFYAYLQRFYDCQKQYYHADTIYYLNKKRILTKLSDEDWQYNIRFAVENRCNFFSKAPTHKSNNK